MARPDFPLNIDRRRFLATGGGGGYGGNCAACGPC